MEARSWKWMVVAGPALALSVVPARGGAQASPVPAPVVRSAIGHCALHPDATDPVLVAIDRARDMENADESEAALDAIEPDVRRDASDKPSDVDAQYHLAAVMGARLDHAEGTGKISGAEQLKAQAERVLQLDPRHAGASYILGRLHATVMRMSGVKRFLATRMLGGGALKGASWEDAQLLLETAVQNGPCTPDHHYELARLYAQRGNPVGAQRELALVRELTTGAQGREARVRAKAEALEEQIRKGVL
jgi:hypothetical protein